MELIYNTNIVSIKYFVVKVGKTPQLKITLKGDF